MHQDILAFPKQDTVYNENTDRIEYNSYGMTLLDYFAAKALIGIASKDNSNNPIPQLAQEAYMLAYAMMEERQRIFKQEQMDAMAKDFGEGAQ